MIGNTNRSSPVQIPGTQWSNNANAAGKCASMELKLMEHYGRGVKHMEGTLFSNSQGNPMTLFITSTNSRNTIGVLENLP